MDTRDYKPAATTVADLVNARAALSRSFDTLSAALGLPGTANETIVPGKPTSTAAALADAQRDAQNAADLLAGMAQTHAAALLDAVIGGGK